MPIGEQNMYNGNMPKPLQKDPSNSGSSSSSPGHRISSSPEGSSTKLSNSKSSTGLTASAKVEKRRANTLAARRYRQKRVDQMNTLESELKDTQAERDALKVRCARLEGEVETLRQLLRSQK